MPAAAVVAPSSTHRRSGTAATSTDVDADLLGRLKVWRGDEARRKGVPAYVVFHDATLAALASARPQTRAALLGVRGLGPAKLEAYGDELLTLLTGD